MAIEALVLEQQLTCLLGCSWGCMQPLAHPFALSFRLWLNKQPSPEILQAIMAAVKSQNPQSRYTGGGQWGACAGSLGCVWSCCTLPGGCRGSCKGSRWRRDDCQHSRVAVAYRSGSSCIVIVGSCPGCMAGWGGGGRRQVACSAGCLLNQWWVPVHLPLLAESLSLLRIQMTALPHMIEFEDFQDGPLQPSGSMVERESIDQHGTGLSISMVLRSSTTSLVVLPWITARLQPGSDPWHSQTVCCICQLCCRSACLSAEAGMLHPHQHVQSHE